MAWHNREIGAVFGLIGSMILLSVGISRISDLHLPTFPYPDIPVGTLYIQAIAIILISVFGLIGAILALKDNLFGYPCLLVAGIGGLVGTFFPIYMSFAGGFLIEIYFMIDSLQYIDIVLIIVGGLLGLILRENEKRKD
ncbi:MAG: hypothetical protein ACFE96_11530 [Candidatus Hermodarchaeota archaeon]